MRMMSRTARMAGACSQRIVVFGPLLDIGSIRVKQGKPWPKGPKNRDFAVLDLVLARTVNGGDCQPPRSFRAATFQPGDPFGQVTWGHSSAGRARRSQ